ncbi:MAG: GNAT family N-acetyltransferase [Thermodesulfobacteriota bacterium]
MIRPFSFDDLNRILQIERQSFPKSPYDWATFVNLHHLYPDTFLVYVETTHDLKGEQILGYIAFSPEGHIISIAVHPRHRRKGIGRQLLERAINAPVVKKVWAEVRRGNQGAQAFYLQMGFQIIGVSPNYYGNEDALIVQWTPLGPRAY